MKSLKYGQITETMIDGKLYDDKITFSIIGKFYYETFSDYKDKIEVIGIMGKCKLSKDFNSIEIIDLYIDTDSHILIQKENYSTLDEIVRNQINSYEMLENVIMKRMEFENLKSNTLDVEKIQITSIEFIPKNFGKIKGTLYTIKKNNKKDIVIIEFYANCKIIENETNLLVNSVDFLSDDLNSYNCEYIHDYVSKYIEMNGYFLENLLGQKNDLGDDNDLQFTF
jgi:hypothetical protein